MKQKMNKNIFLSHKKEKEELLSKTYVTREQIKEFKKFLNSNLIKIITGPRRAGKSVFCFELLKDTNFAYLNFDDENLLKIDNYDEIVPMLEEVYPKYNYIFFDEIQNLPNWEIFVNKLYRRGANLIITGSNAKLLAMEMATALTGRYIPLEVLPFSFREYLKAKKFSVNANQKYSAEEKNFILSSLDVYMQNGGFPEIVVNNLTPSSYLSTLFDSIIFKDIAVRHKIRSPKDIYNLGVFMTSNSACEMSYNKIAEFVEIKSTATLIKYTSYLEESYIFDILNRFSFKAKKQINSPKKVYLLDNGFISAKSLGMSVNSGRLMENMYYCEMIRQGYKKNDGIFYYRSDNGAEIDFVLKKATKIEKLVQLCFNVNNHLTLERELKPLVLQSDLLKCNALELVTWDQEGIEKCKNKQIQIIPIWKVFLNR